MHWPMGFQVLFIKWFSKRNSLLCSNSFSWQKDHELALGNGFYYFRHHVLAMSLAGILTFPGLSTGEAWIGRSLKSPLFSLRSNTFIPREKVKYFPHCHCVKADIWRGTIATQGCILCHSQIPSDVLGPASPCTFLPLLCIFTFSIFHLHCVSSRLEMGGFFWLILFYSVNFCTHNYSLTPPPPTRFNSATFHTSISCER